MELGKEWKLKFADREVTVSTGKYCGMSNGSCFVRCGDTVIMVNATMSKEPREDVDFFPLSVDFEEKMYAVGKFPGGYKKREGRASDKAILVSRLIDRPLRPLFPKGFYNDVSIVATAMSVDPEVPPEPLAMLGSSIALELSDIPFAGPVGAVNVGFIDGKFVINPTTSEQEKSTMSVTVAGTKEAILMVEAGAQEVSEEQMIDAIMYAHDFIKEQVEFQEKIREETGFKVNPNIKYFIAPDEVKHEVQDFCMPLLKQVYEFKDKFQRDAKDEEISKIINDHFEPLYPDNMREVNDAIYALRKVIVRTKILENGERPDGRTLTEIRPIWCEVGVLPRVHGSGVFTRGHTQVMTTLTLASLSEAQELDGIDDEEMKRYIHHYNMPGYSTGEAKPLKSPGRREIGHGALAERALLPVLPSEEEFPYAIRTVSEVLSSNGSTSQASVCGSTLALMDGGVPIKAPVAGIAMGLIKDPISGKVCVMSDIQGLEDFFGDMDFKVAGTNKGITAIQMDIKIKGIDKNILTTALMQARDGRLFILGKMLAVIDKPRPNVSEFAPKIISFNIDPDKIKDVIGTGGKVINDIIAKTGVKIDISDVGLVQIACVDLSMAEKAKEIILSIVTPFEIGKIYDGVVVRIATFGAFVQVGNKEGMIHISKLSDKRVEKVEDVVKIGDAVKVQVIKVDDKDRVDFKLVK
jgi:polyribonucleotide nucleotidyltransferase